MLDVSEVSVPRMMFLNALVHHAGSTAAAGRALEDLLRRGSTAAADAAACEGLAAWAKALAKPEHAAGGGGWDFNGIIMG